VSDNDVTYERQVADLPEAQRLIDAICDAMWAYKTFLEKHGLIWNADWEKEGSLGDPLKAKKLIAEINFEYPDCGQLVDVHLAGGALDRAYSDQPLDAEGRPRPKQQTSLAARSTAPIAINRSTLRAGQDQNTEPRWRRARPRL
jgi:hypothetical protein